jgi:hypothetical protein
VAAAVDSAALVVEVQVAVEPQVVGRITFLE